MPAPKKSGSPKASKRPQKTSWLSRLGRNRYGKPIIVAVAFMLFGGGALLWASAATTTYSLWSTSAVPKVITSSDTRSLELGVKFKSSVAGYVTGVRFYKGPQNTGTHTGSLWDSSGKLLATTTFKNESASGWQSVDFAQPVNIAANVTYVISYHAPMGHYSVNANYFKNGSHSRKSLTAPQSRAADPNGVYTSATNTAFPLTSGNGANYWVDVNFSEKLLNPQPAPAAPTSVLANVQSNSVVLSWAASQSSNSISQYIIYRDGGKIATVDGATLTYTDSSVTAGSTYGYQVQAVDSTGTSSALSTAVSATIPSSTGTGGSGGATGTTTCPAPKYPSPSCTGIPAGTTITRTVNGDYPAQTPGEVIDGWHITGDVNIKAAGVVIKNSQIDGTVSNDGIPNTSFTISDSTVGTTTCNKVGTPSLWGHDINAARVFLQGHADGIDMGASNVEVSDSFIQPCFLPGSIVGGDGFHTDGMQDLCSTTCGNIRMVHTTIDARAFYGGKPMGNSALNLGSSADGLHLRDVTLNGNLFMGGGYTTDLRWDADNSWSVNFNAWVDGAWTYAPISTEGTCINQNWQGNTIVSIDGSYNLTGAPRSTGCVD